MMKISLQTPSVPRSRVTGTLRTLHAKRERGRKEAQGLEKRRNGKKEVELSTQIFIATLKTFIL